MLEVLQRTGSAVLPNKGMPPYLSSGGKFPEVDPRRCVAPLPGPKMQLTPFEFWTRCASMSAQIHCEACASPRIIKLVLGPEALDAKDASIRPGVASAGRSASFVRVSALCVSSICTCVCASPSHLVKIAETSSARAQFYHIARAGRCMDARRRARSAGIASSIGSVGQWKFRPTGFGVRVFKGNADSL